MWISMTYCFPLSSDAVRNSWKFYSAFASFLMAFPHRTMEHFCYNWLFTLRLGHAEPTLKFFAFSSYLIFFSALLDFWLLKKKNTNKRNLYWGKIFRLLQYSSVAVAVFLQLCCYFCVLQNPCLGYKLQQKEQTLPPVSIYKLFKLLLARPSSILFPS